MRKFNKLFIIISIILLSITCMGCKNLNVSYIETRFSDGEDVTGQYHFIETKKELRLLFFPTKIPEKYDDFFFETNSIIIFKNIETSLENESVIKSYNIENENLIINVQTVHLGDSTTIGHYWFILELKKEEIDKIEKIKIIKNNIEIISGSKNEEIWHYKPISFEEVSFNGNLDFNKMDVNISTIFYSKEEVVEEFSKFEINWRDVPFWDKLSDDFFEHNVLVTWIGCVGGSNVSRKIDSIYVKDSKIIIKLAITKCDDGIMLDDVVFYPIILKVNKKEIKTVNSVELIPY